MQADLLGIRLNGRYELQHFLGRGGMALVLTAHDHVLDRQVAVKIVRPDLTWSSDAADTFIREARIIARLDHPHILHIYDLGTERIGHKPLVYLVMQWAGGGTLAHRLEAGPLPPDEVQKILQQVGDALDYAHRQGVIHLDLKPANILFDEHGNALVADFGLAKLLQETTHAKADTGVGTPAYMAPEQWLGGKVSPSSDVYALGLILYQMLTGQLPERKWTEQGPVPQPEASLPPDARPIIEKAIQTDPNRRYATAGEMVRAFLETSRPQQVTARPSWHKALPEREPEPEIQESRRKIPLRPLAIGMALIIVIVGLLLSGAGLQRSRGTAGKEAAALAALPASTVITTATFTPTPTPSPSPSPSPSPTPSLTPSLTPTPSPVPYAVVIVERATIYAGPGETYEPLGEVKRGDRLLVRGRLADGEWLQVDYVGWLGWISAQAVTLSLPPTSLPLVETPPIPTLTPTPVPTATPMPTPTPACPTEPTGEFAYLWRNPLVQDRLGCPFDSPSIIKGVIEAFQNGLMYWREDLRWIYVIYNDGHWESYEDTWAPPEPERIGLTPPPGLVEPRRGFGKVWREQLGGPEAAIGWATEEEYPLPSRIQNYERGMILEVNSVTYLLYSDMSWQDARMIPPSPPTPTAPPEPIGLPSHWRIVFASERSGNIELYIMNADGSDQRRLTDNPAEDDRPAVSPDGQWIAFQSDRDGNSEIYVMRVDGSELRRVTTNPGKDHLPKWSPDGRWILFSSERNGVFDLYAIRPDGTGLRRITRDEFYDGYASWSKGDWIVYHSGEGEKAYTTWEIVVIKADGSGRRQLTHNDVNDWSPNWSPDGRSILFISRRGGDPAIYMMDADGSNPRLVYDSPGYEWGASFSPDGQWIAFTSDQSGEHEVYVMKSDGSYVTRLTYEGGWYPSWVP